MTQKKLSTFGYIMEYMNIQNTTLSQILQVDASLVSKWKSGDRILSTKSPYFDELTSFFMKHGKENDYYLLKEALKELYPYEAISTEEELIYFLKQALTSAKPRKHLGAWSMDAKDASSSIVTIFWKTEGRRQACRKLLEYAESMKAPGKLIFCDSEEYKWIVEDSSFATEFSKRMTDLLHKGFKAQFIIRYSACREHFVRLFEVCSPLIFDRNVEWYYHEYYDEEIMNVSFFILNHAISMIGLTAEDVSETIAFKDAEVSFRHEMLVNSEIAHCRRLFTCFGQEKAAELLAGICEQKKRGTIYAYLPVPAFMAADPELIQEIMDYNGILIEDPDEWKSVNRKVRDIFSLQMEEEFSEQASLVYVFQIEEMLARARNYSFISCSLSLLGGRQVKISERQYAAYIRAYAAKLIKYPNLSIVLISREDMAPLPEINCWCKQNS